MDELVSIVESTARPSCRVRVEGKSRPLVSTVRDEIQRIAREALRNAFSHSHGRTIEAEISYGETTFALRVRDDGVGINTRVL
ncbi:ATP-binding protein, partial [Acinetobacter baumannii]